jgi:DNA-binding NarL/FixJ family response regulator
VSAPQRVLVVEDDRRLRALIPGLMGGHGLVVTCVGSARDALASLDAVDPDVVVVDLGLPDMDGVDLIEILRARRPATPVVVLTIASSEARIMAALRKGACGYLFKEDLGRRLAPAIADAFDGGAPMSPAVAQLVLAQVRAPRALRPSSDATLTPREQEVIEHIARGLTYDEVAVSLGVTVNTVRTHIRVLYGKLDVTTKTEAVMAALRLGLLTT